MHEPSPPQPPEPLDALVRDAPGIRPGVLLATSMGALALFIVLSVAREAPAIEEDIRTRALAAFAEAQLDWVQFTVDGRDLTLLGEAPSAAARNTAWRLAYGLEGVRIVRSRTTLKPQAAASPAPVADAAEAAAPVPYDVVLRSDGVHLTLTGAVPAAPAAEELVAKAHGRFTVAAVDDRLRREEHGTAPEGWEEASAAALEALVLLEHGEARVAETRIELAGVAAEPALRARARQELARRTPRDFASEARIDLVALPGAPSRADCQAQIDALLGAARIEFASGSALLQPESMPVVDELADIARRCTGLQLEIAGHTDDRGDPRANLDLSQRRAEAVMAYLVDHGVALSRLTAVGYGEERPVVRDTTDEARARNRRIEILARAQ
jgi:outer membrane protein OmpA-like peptidoglycan-associated protein